MSDKKPTVKSSTTATPANSKGTPVKQTRKTPASKTPATRAKAAPASKTPASRAKAAPAKPAAPRSKNGTHTTVHSKVTPDTNLAAELGKLMDPVQNAIKQAPRRKGEAQWQPSLQMRGDEGTLTSKPMFEEQSRDFSFDDLLREFKLDPEEYEVQEPVHMNKWEAQTPDGMQWLFQHKVKIVRRRKDPNQVDVQELLTAVDKWRPRKTKPALGEGVFNVVIADWQVGGTEGEAGTADLFGRVAHAIEAVKERAMELRKLGRPLGALQIICVGDLVENINGFYDNQLATTDMDLRTQVTVTRRLLTRAVMEWADLFPDVRFIGVGGNHGENRLGGIGGGGKLMSAWSDNWDLSIYESVSEVLAANPAKFGHVKFLIPREDLCVTVDTCGWILGVHHGHLGRAGANAEQKMFNWYKNMAAGGMPVGDSQILITGHYHHFRYGSWGKCTWLQAPALDNGSRWFQEQVGQHDDPGVLTFCTYPETKIADLQVLAVPHHLRNNPQPTNKSFGCRH